MLELITVMIVLGLLAALRHAQRTVVARRRLVCVTVGSSSVTLSSASANGATSCDSTINGPDGNSIFANNNDAGSATSVSPAGTLYFQPSDRVTADGAGTSAATRSISLAGESDTTVNGETGHVE